jgi:hypothetical protein
VQRKKYKCCRYKGRYLLMSKKQRFSTAPYRKIMCHLVHVSPFLFRASDVTLRRGLISCLSSDGKVARFYINCDEVSVDAIAPRIRPYKTKPLRQSLPGETL